ncbi:cystathionine gamma-synthase [Deinobacterium chartae]|uniref:Cystathionine gamma-synthase n=1 Tax=Deinobacterium chartae TaxID=521158 RepID=A0A841I4W5_9DEIO|nr:aminotransferase class I/II-fold pyridoxal phosphate-dependent enzyme [Deinobacterium chartae]MBB6100074.1 cystathionine gamma-synthase [Deinobacterium chartae]
MTYTPQTLAARAGEEAAPHSGRPLIEGIAASTVYAFDSLTDLEAALSGSSGLPFYYRNGTPNAATLERAVAALEGTEAAVCAASGMGALLGAFLAIAAAGDHIVADQQAYGGTFALLTAELPRLGIEVSLVDATDLEAVTAALRPNTRLLHVEALSNPLMTVADLPALAELAHAHGARLSVDSTFASPALLRPAEHGADLVVHSLSKYLSGHSNAMGGIVAGSRELIESVRLRLVRLGATVSAFDAWMTLQGLKTLGLRMRAHAGNAQAIADVLSNHPRIERVYHPGLEDHPQFELAQRLFPEGYGGMLSFELRGDLEEFVARLRGKIPLAPSLADVASTLSYPAGTSHRALSPEARAALGISDQLLRLSVGIEDIGDLLADLEAALA